MHQLKRKVKLINTKRKHFLNNQCIVYYLLGGKKFQSKLAAICMIKWLLILPTRHFTTIILTVYRGFSLLLYLLRPLNAIIRVIKLWIIQRPKTVFNYIQFEFSWWTNEVTQLVCATAAYETKLKSEFGWSQIPFGLVFVAFPCEFQAVCIFYGCFNECCKKFDGNVVIWTKRVVRIMWQFQIMQKHLMSTMRLWANPASYVIQS